MHDCTHKRQQIAARPPYAHETQELEMVRNQSDG